MPYKKSEHIEPPSGERLATLEMWCRGKDQKDDSRHADNVKRMDEILEQVKKTNGRVNDLEAWQDKIKGGAKATQYLIGTLGAILGYLLGKLLHFT